MTFDPRQHLIQLKGKDYIEVKWRLVWLTETAPTYSIDCDVVELNERRCVCKARVTVTAEDGSVRSAEGIGSETPQDFTDYIEKANTKAVGRALAMVGYGTQFAVEFEGEAEAGRIVDAPVERPRPQPSGQAVAHAPAQGNGQPVERVAGGATSKQVWLVRKLASEKGVNPEQFAQEQVGVGDLNQLSGGRDGTASYLIDKLQNLTISDVPF